MSTQYTAKIGSSERDVVRTTFTADPLTDEVVVILETVLVNTGLYAVSQISESMVDLSERFMNPTQYGFVNGSIAGLSKKIDGPNGIAKVVANVAALPPGEMTILVGTGIREDSGLVKQTIETIRDFYLSSDGVQ